ncbi:MAG: dTMP kinase [Clostridia bacterium]|nr:dTMP kinase [Clostridia bacterium]
MDKKLNTGVFITFEGIDGCGKSVQSRRLAVYLQKKGYKCRLTFEPGDCALGEELRRVLLKSPAGSLSARTEALLFATARAQHVDEVIIPALKRGEIVICDRFIDSTIAYQGAGRGLDIKFLQALNAFATDGLEPDLTFVLRVSVATSLGRRKQDFDRIEEEGKVFFSLIADAYSLLAEQNPQRIKVIDGEADEDRVFAQICQKLEQFLASEGE